MGDKEKKGLEILFSALKRKFPFFTKIEKSKSSNDWVIFLIFTVDVRKFWDFYDGTIDKMYQGKSNDEIKKYFGISGFKWSYLMALVDEKFETEFGSEYNNKLDSLINGLYKSLPIDYIEKNEYGNPKMITISQYIYEINEDEN